VLQVQIENPGVRSCHDWNLCVYHVLTLCGKLAKLITYYKWKLYVVLEWQDQLTHNYLTNDYSRKHMTIWQISN